MAWANNYFAVVRALTTAFLNYNVNKERIRYFLKKRGNPSQKIHISQFMYLLGTNRKERKTIPKCLTFLRGVTTAFCFG